MVSNQVDYKEGAASADFEAGSTQYMSITDANLDAGFPLKNGDANKKISVCGWFQMESSNIMQGLFSKYDWGSNERSLMIRISPAGPYFELLIGYNGGTSGETVYSGGTLSNERWYHFGVTFQDSDKSWKVVVWDDTGESKIIDTSGTATNNINIEAAIVAIGMAYFNDGTPLNGFDGEIDEVVVFKDILTTGEIDEIRQGVYGA